MKKMTTSENLHLFNTLTRKKEKFVPIESGKVKMYTCGPTVWDYAHIGNFRSFIFEDILRRWLKYRGFKITQVMNITDVDDRTIAASKKQGIPLDKYTSQFVQAFFEDIQALGVEKAEHYPKATENIPEMVTLIGKLVEKDYAYVSEDGSIYYDISKFKNYGQLSKVKIGELKEGARVRADDYEKEEAKDFALWKAWDESDGNVYWETSIGKGRPGWHIECSAMSMKYLGDQIDIHTGGVDNLFPHHENEIAQSEAITGKKFVNYWLHCEHLLVNGKRMGKRFGNYYTLRDLNKLGHDPRTIRYLLMSTHYRQQFNFTFEGLEAAKKAIERLSNFQQRLSNASGVANQEADLLAANAEVKFDKAMDDDLDIGTALASFFEFIREANNLLDKNEISCDQARRISNWISQIDKVLGVIGEAKKKQALSREAVELIQRRESARKAKDWKEADRIREELKAMGITLEDTAEGVRWRIEGH
jgi:cysteinyl-tRNA synthetase